MNITTFHNYNNTTMGDEKPHIIEGIGYVVIALLIIVIIFCCYQKSNDYDDEARIDRAKTRLVYRYGGSKV